MAVLTVYTSASDGCIYGVNANYTTAHDAANGTTVYNTSISYLVGQQLASGDYTLMRSFLFFDTSAIPDVSVITQVVLSLYLGSDFGNPVIDFDVVVRNGQPTYPHDPIVLGDYLYSHYSGDGGSWNTSKYIGAGYHSITLNSTGIGWISKTGATKLALISQRDIDSITPITVDSETLRIRSYEDSLDHRAYLTITYHVPPTVSISAVSDIGTITATGNGNVTDTGGTNSTKRGVCWNTTGSPTIADSKSEETGSFGTGAFTRPMTGLLRGERYYVRAYAYNSAGYGYSPTEVDFYTYPSVTTYVPTDIIRAGPTVVTANGLIDLDVVENITTRGFKYGLTETDTWDESEEGIFSEGAFSLQLTGLNSDTTYYIRAYATGAWGTKYGSYVEFKTAYPYGSFKTEIKTEAVASQSDIDAVGGKQSLLIENHLIQNQTLADLVAAGYLADYKDQKTKLTVTKPTPAPYEIGDTIKRDMGAELPYYFSSEALISYAAAANAVHYYKLAGRNMLIRKLNVSFSAGNYISVLELES